MLRNYEGHVAVKIT